MTERERICFALGYMACAHHLHNELDRSGEHEDDSPFTYLCEATNIFAGKVAEQAIAPMRREGRARWPLSSRSTSAGMVSGTGG